MSRNHKSYGCVTYGEGIYMRKILNTLYITTPELYLSLDGENVVIKKEQQEVGRLPLHNLEGIVSCGYIGASPSLMEKCANNNISLSFLSTSGRFKAKVTGKSYGNILLRRQQYRMADQRVIALSIAKNFILGKIYNERSVVNRAVRDYTERMDTSKFKHISEQLQQIIIYVKDVTDIDTLRGLEGKAANYYFSVFDDLILHRKDEFYFKNRNRRPPMDKTNALLSFSYTLLAGMCVSALETVGLDPYAGFMHTDRPGRCSLALDMLEELRSPYADRFVLSLINKKMISPNNFEVKENGAVLLTEEGRKLFLGAWQNKKVEKMTHPFLQENMEWGLVPYAQAMLLARYIRGDLEEYPPFFWK